MSNQPNSAPLLQVHDLQVSYRSTGRREVNAVTGVNFQVNSGEVVAIVGESGSGKSTTAHAILGLLPPAARLQGSVLVNGRELVGMHPKLWREVRGREVAFIPQDPTASLNPTRRIGTQIAEAITTHDRLITPEEVGERVHRLLEKVGIPQPLLRARQYPHELSGGMRQRVLIAAALAAEPQLIVADEPTSALDVTVQKQILDHIDELRSELDLAVLLITHDLGVASDRADQILVMSQGQIVERGTPSEVIAFPQHDYTRRLVAAVPTVAHGRLRWDGAKAVAQPEAESLQLASTGQDILTADRISKTFKSAKSQAPVRAVQQVSVQVQRGQTLGIVGESGSGKSTLARILAHLALPDAGAVHLAGHDVTHLAGQRLREHRRDIQLVYQNPFTSIDPRFTITKTLVEPLRAFKVGTRSERLARASELLDLVGLPREFGARKPQELSGGQLQRVAIARAIAAQPQVLILDEAVSALDVSVQAQILQLLARLQAELDLTMVFISHDLAVIRQISDTVAVMHGGELVEFGSATQVFNQPRSSVTAQLLQAIPGERLHNFQAPQGVLEVPDQLSQAEVDTVLSPM